MVAQQIRKTRYTRPSRSTEAAGGVSVLNHKSQASFYHQMKTPVIAVGLLASRGS
jgi:hypothetical protein